MGKTILLTGATDGIGLETAKILSAAGHNVLLHGRSAEKLAGLKETLSQVATAGAIEVYRADLSRLEEVEALAGTVASRHRHLDVLINNAGVYKLSGSSTQAGLEVRFLVNTIAPYLLTRRLLPLFSTGGRVINLSSAAQAPVDLDALRGKRSLGDGEAYAQSKLALTMWSFELARELGDAGPAIIAVNPAALLATKMVKDAYGVAGNDLRIGADILVRAALDDEFADASGRYYDNDNARFADPHYDALDPNRTGAIVSVIEEVISTHSPKLAAAPRV